MSGTRRLTVGQAVVTFLSRQYVERDGVEQRFIPGFFGIFGHGNVAGLGQALLEAHRTDPGTMPYRLARNEQGMVHTAVGYARASGRLRTLACTASIGPGSTNMVTGAALATVNRLPVLLLPSDVFATRHADPVLQQLEVPWAGDVSVNDAFRPVSRFFDRVWRPEMLPAALLGAMRVLTDPAETGAATIALPQDVQAEAYDWPESLLAKRVWSVARQAPDPAAIVRAAASIRRAQRPLVVAGGGVVHSGAWEALRRLADATGLPVAETQAGKGSLPWDHPCSVGALGVSGTTAANTLAREADVVIGIGTRYTDFTTASGTLFADDARFVNVTIASFDAAKRAGELVVGDARTVIEALTEALTGWTTADEYRSRAVELSDFWQDTVQRAQAERHTPLPSQTEVIGAVNAVAGPGDVVVCAAGSMPGDLHRQWRTVDPHGYHVEYGYSCMGYEIAGGIGVRLAQPDREVFVLVGDGSYLMMAQELVTAVAEGIKVVVVLVDNQGFASIGALSESVGSQRFGTRYRRRDPATGELSGELLGTDLAANAESLGARVLRTRTIDGLQTALTEARQHEGGPVVVHIEVDPMLVGPQDDAWWDVPVAEVSGLESTRRARASYAAGPPQLKHLPPGS